MLSALFLMPAIQAADSRAEALRQAEHARLEAIVSADGATLDKLLDDGLEYAHSNGAVDSKQSFIESLTSGRVDYVSIVANPESVRLFGDVGVIRGSAKITVVDAGRTLDLKLGYTDVWVWKDGAWRMTAWRSARLPDSPVQ